MIEALEAKGHDADAQHLRALVMAPHDVKWRCRFEVGLARDHEGTPWLPTSFVDRWVGETREAMLAVLGEVLH
jgi:hypothetical protein